MGCPSAIAPPFTLSLSLSKPSSLPTATDCAAKASLASTRSISAIFSPPFSSASFVAGTGPIPMMRGSTPAEAWLQAKLVCLPAAHDHNGCRSIVEAGRVACRDHAALLKGGAQFGKCLCRGVAARLLVGIEDGRAFPPWHLNRHDLVAKTPGLDGMYRALLALQRELVEFFACQVVIRADIFGGDAHVAVIEDIPQAILNHLINYLPVAHAVAEACLLQQVRSAAHALHAASKHHFVIAQAYRLSREYDAFQAAAADLVHSHRRDVNG